MRVLLRHTTEAKSARNGCTQTSKPTTWSPRCAASKLCETLEQ